MENLIKAIGKFDYNTVKSIIESNPDFYIKKCNEKNILHWATNHENLLAVELLLKHNADVNVRNTDEQTSLLLASRSGNEEIVELLLKHGADCNIVQSNGNTPLLILSTAHLEERSEDLDNDLNEIPLSAEEISSNHKRFNRILTLLLEHGANVNLANKDGHTALMGASFRGDIGKVKILLEHGADVSLKSADGHTALMHAAERYNTEIVKLLLEHGAEE